MKPRITKDGGVWLVYCGSSRQMVFGVFTWGQAIRIASAVGIVS